MKKQIRSLKRSALFGLCLLGILVLVAACGGGSSNTASNSTPTSAALSPTDIATTGLTPSATSGQTATPTKGATATPTKGMTPTPTPTNPPAPTATPTRPPNPSPTPRPTPTPTPTPVTISIIALKGGKFGFSPASIRIPLGTTVTWVNDTKVAHTVTSDNGLFNDSFLGSGKSFSFTFTAVGTDGYHCNFHPEMIATITVT